MQTKTKEQPTALTPEEVSNALDNVLWEYDKRLEIIGSDREVGGCTNMTTGVAYIDLDNYGCPDKKISFRNGVKIAGEIPNYYGVNKLIEKLLAARILNFEIVF